MESDPEGPPRRPTASTGLGDQEAQNGGENLQQSS